jgi:hypothetical protein
MDEDTVVMVENTVMDEETIARLQRNDPTLTSLRLETSFVELPPAASICCSESVCLFLFFFCFLVVELCCWLC